MKKSSKKYASKNGRTKAEFKEERARFETLLKEQRKNTTENIEKIVILHQQSEEKADTRQDTLLNNLLDALRK